MIINAGYVGFTPKLLVREYSFVVREELAEPLEITFTIPNRAFASGRLSFQNAPDLCSLKLHREIAGSINNALKTHYRINEVELDDYNNSHLPKTVRSFAHVSRPKVSKPSGISTPNSARRR